MEFTGAHPDVVIGVLKAHGVIVEVDGDNVTHWRDDVDPEVQLWGPGCEVTCMTLERLARRFNIPVGQFYRAEEARKIKAAKAKLPANDQDTRSTGSGE